MDVGSGGAGEAEALLLRELRAGVERLLEEQERLVANFVRQKDGHSEAAGLESSPVSEASENDAKTAAAFGQPGEEVRQGESRQPPARLTSGHSGFLERMKSTLNEHVIEEDPETHRAHPLRVLWSSEPERKGLLARAVQSKSFEILTLVVILLNGALVLYQTEHAALLARRDPAGQTGVQVDVVFVIDQIFMAFFVTEVLLRLLVHRLYFFCNDNWFWNIFSLTIVAAAALDVLTGYVSDDAEEMDATLFRVLRIFRMFRSLRLVRALRFVRPLRQLVECMAQSMAVVFWCVALLCLVTGIFATFLVQCVTAFILDGGASELAGSTGGPEAMEVLSSSFGGILLAMWTLFKAASGGEDWAPYFNLLARTGLMAPGVYLVYIIFCFIAAWNIVSSLFMEKVMSLSQPDMDQQLLDKRRQDLADARDLRSLLETIDVDQSGTISMEEFKHCLSQHRFRSFFAMHSIDIKDAEAFFAMLETVAGSSHISLDVAVNGLMRMRGLATSMDLQALQFQLQVNKGKFDKSLEDLKDMLGRISSQFRVNSRVRQVTTIVQEEYVREEEATKAASSKKEQPDLDQPRRSEAMTAVERDIDELAITPISLAAKSFSFEPAGTAGARPP